MRANLILYGAWAAALALPACASSIEGGAPSPQTDFDVSATQFEGWAQVAGGEIRLFQKERDLYGLPQRCVSAALPRNAQDTAGDLSGSRIRLYGRTLEWSRRDGPETHTWRGSRITNGCYRNVIILADRVEVIR